MDHHVRAVPLGPLHSDPVTDRPTLRDLFAKYGSDKGHQPAEPWMWEALDYGAVYDPLFAPLRDEPITFLELGWGEWCPELKSHANPNVGGRSAAAWRDYFTKADIHVVDIEDKNCTVPGVNLWRGSQADADFLAEVHADAGDFDVIVDDASHISSLTITSFQLLWPYLKPGGIYIVEDLHSSFHSYWFGASEASIDPGDFVTRSAFNYFRRLAAEPYFRGTYRHGPKIKVPGGWSRYEHDCYPRKYWLGYDIAEVRFVAPQLVILRKKGA